MQMTEQEFKDLMAHFYFLGDKIDPVYKRETDKPQALRGRVSRPPFYCVRKTYKDDERGAGVSPAPRRAP